MTLLYVLPNCTTKNTTLLKSTTKEFYQNYEPAKEYDTVKKYNGHCNGSTVVLTLHCPKNTLSLHIKTLFVTSWSGATVYRIHMYYFSLHIVSGPETVYTKEYIFFGIYHCICSNRDRLGFYAENQLIFGTVYSTFGP